MLLRVFFAILIVLCTTNNRIEADMASVFDECDIRGNNINDNDENVAMSSEMHYQNEIECTKSCQPFSFKMHNNTIEINDDIILECKNACRQNYESYKACKKVANETAYSSQTPDGKKINIPTETYRFSAPIMVQFKKNLSQSEEDNTAIKKFFSIDIPHDTTLTVSLNTQYDNTLFNCGHKIIELVPTTPNIYELFPQSVDGGNTNSTAILQRNIINQQGNIYKTYDFTFAKHMQLDDIKEYTLFEYNRYLQDLNYNDVPFQDTAERMLCNNHYIFNILTCTKFNISSELCQKCMQKYPFKQNDVSRNDKELLFLVNSKKMDNFYMPELLHESPWSSNDASLHACFANSDSIPHTNTEIVNLVGQHNDQDKNISINNFPEKVGCYYSWNVYNTNYTDLDIKLNDNDFLRIEWNGSIILGNGLTVPWIDSAVAKRIAINPESFTKTFSKNKNVNIPQGILKDITALDLNINNKQHILYGEDAAIPVNYNKVQSSDGYVCNEICEKKSIYDNLISNKNSKSHIGLTGTLKREPSIVTKDEKSPLPCDKTNIIADSYVFSGYVDGVGSNASFKIRHYLPINNYKNLFKESVLGGGQKVKIIWGGCPMTNGSNLQYAFGTDTTLVNEVIWYDLILSDTNIGIQFSNKNLEKKDNQIIVPNDITKIFFRINGNTSTQHSKNYSPDGGYHLKVISNGKQIKKGDSFIYNLTDTFEEKWLTVKFVKVILNTLIGDIDALNKDDVESLNGSIFVLTNSLIKSIAKIIQLILVLYVAIIGINVIAGLTKTTQKEFISIVLKAFLIGMVLSENTWNWFMRNYIGMFIITPFKIASILNNLIIINLRSLNISLEEIIAHSNVLDVFRLFNFVFVEVIFNGNLIEKILALGFSSLVGLVMAILLVMVIVYLLLSTIKGVISYMSIIISHCVLLIIAPFFFICKLFKITEGMFDQWTKQVMVFTILPVVVSCTIALFFTLILIFLDIVFGFHYCKGCILNIRSLCIIKSYYILDLAFIPKSGQSDFILPFGVFSGGIALLFISWLAIQASDLGTGIITRLITFRPEATSDNTSMIGITQNVGINTAVVVAQSAVELGAAGSSLGYSDIKRPELDKIGNSLDQFKKKYKI